MSLRFFCSLLTVFALTIVSTFFYPSFAAAPATFSQAKVALKQQVYFDQNKHGALGTIYCGCDWQWLGRSGGRIDAERCGYTIRAIPTRGKRIEIEHVVPASWLGQQRLCWQNGGRKNCNKTDPVFNAMEADLHNMTIAVGELNADRSNYRFGMLPGTPKKHGQCNSKVDFKKRVFEPRDEAKGIAARIMFYMHDRYNLKMSKQQQQLYMAWNKQFPVTHWELERDRRIAGVMGHSNEFVTGGRSWTVGHRNRADGVAAKMTGRVNTKPAKQLQQNAKHNNQSPNDSATQPIRGNRNSKIYHMQHCSTYNAISPHNIVNFANEIDALNAGYRKAKNCR